MTIFLKIPFSFKSKIFKKLRFIVLRSNYDYDYENYNYIQWRLHRYALCNSLCFNMTLLLILYLFDGQLEFFFSENCFIYHSIILYVIDDNNLQKKINFCTIGVVLLNFKSKDCPRI